MNTKGHSGKLQRGSILWKIWYTAAPLRPAAVKRSLVIRGNALFTHLFFWSVGLGGLMLLFMLASSDAAGSQSFWNRFVPCATIVCIATELAALFIPWSFFDAADNEVPVAVYEALGQVQAEPEEMELFAHVVKNLGSVITWQDLSEDNLVRLQWRLDNQRARALHRSSADAAVAVLGRNAGIASPSDKPANAIEEKGATA